MARHPRRLEEHETDTRSLATAVRVFTTRRPNERKARDRGQSLPKQKRLWRRYPHEALVFDTETLPGPAQNVRVLVWRLYRDRSAGLPGETCIEEGIAYPDDLPRNASADFQLLRSYAAGAEGNVAPGFPVTLRLEPLSWWLEHRLYRYGAYFVSVLNSLGYKTRLKILRGGPKSPNVADSRTQAQVGRSLWIADYPSANNYFFTLLTCASFEPRNPQNFNLSEFCDHNIDSEIDRARVLQTSDPHSAALLWSKIDREVVDQAPWVAYGNLQQIDFVSGRVGNYTYNPQWGVLLDQLWVR